MPEKFANRAEVFEQCGYKLGFLIGEELGMAEGRRDVLRRILERIVDKNDGALSDAIATLINQASPEKLDLWIERALNGDQPVAIFGDG